MKKIRTYWWSAKNLEGEIFENFGDVITPYLVEKITGKKSIWTNIKKKRTLFSYKKVLVGVGSILNNVNSDCIVWGAGIMYKNDKINKADYRVVRGYYSQQQVMKSTGIFCKTMGDPALCLPTFYIPKKEKHKIGIIPHFLDYDIATSIFGKDDAFKIIDLKNDVESVISDICECGIVYSSSLHGIITSHAYGIESYWIKLSNNLAGDGVKFLDYFSSVNISLYKPTYVLNKFDLSKVAKSSGVDKLEIDSLSNKIISQFPYDKSLLS